MPKKLSTNSKAVEAKARKDAVRQVEKTKKETEAEEALWKDDDKSLQRKQQRKEEKDKKRTEQLERKTANKVAYEEELSTIKAAKPLPTKVTRADIEEHLMNPDQHEIVADTPLKENINRISIEGEEARSVDDAIAVLSLSSSEKLDKHPERRMKAAYEAFENSNLPRLKAENPNLRLSQLKQILKKDWMKSEENPLNQRHTAYNTKSS